MTSETSEYGGNITDFIEGLFWLSALVIGGWAGSLLYELTR